MAEYTNMVVVSCIAVTLFLGGWLRPFTNVRALDFLKFAPIVLTDWERPRLSFGSG
jgi:NADH:ubiquinone oxidoreductase subunit H